MADGRIERKNDPAALDRPALNRWVLRTTQGKRLRKRGFVISGAGRRPEPGNADQPPRKPPMEG
jgi:hypothetical protein